MISAIIEMFTMWVGSGLFNYGMYHVMALALLATVPYIIRNFVYQKGGTL